MLDFNIWINFVIVFRSIRKEEQNENVFIKNTESKTNWRNKKNTQYWILKNGPVHFRLDNKSLSTTGKMLTEKIA